MTTKTITLTDRRINAASVKIGNEGDNNAERIKFVLPARLMSAAVFLFLSIDGYSDVVQLTDDRIFVPERKHTQYPGKWRAYLQAVANNDVVWHSDEFTLLIGNLPPTGKQIPQQYPTAIEEALRAVDTLTGVGARAETLPPGSQATVSFEEDAEGNRTIVYGIPRGRDGTGGTGGTGGGGGTGLPDITEKDEGKVLMVKDGAAGWQALPTYAGEYAVTPTVDGQTLATAQKLMQDDVTINPIPYYEVGNTSGGDTAYIGKELE